MARILLIDDESAVRKMLRDVLEELGHDVFDVANGLAGVEYLGKSPVDLVITDIFMPDMGGIEMVCHIRENNPAIKIITISGGGILGDTSVLNASGQLGADLTLWKPVAVGDLEKAIDAVLAPQP